MPFTYEMDEATRRVTITMIGEFKVEEALEVLERQRGDGSWSFCVLYDMRQMTGRPSLDEVKKIFGLAAQPGPGSEMRGPLALLVTDPTLYSMACAYMALGVTRRKIEVFREPDEAQQWLAHHVRTAS